MGWCQGDKRTVHHPEVQFTIPRGFQGPYTLKLHHIRVEPPYDIHEEPSCQCLGFYPVLRVCATLRHPAPLCETKVITLLLTHLRFSLI